ncbi:MAG TPA: GNAT family N-acetyltransferase [Candidatus Acidoferrales bacterium]
MRSEGGLRPDFRVESLRARHDRESFTCGVAELDRYLKAQASQHIRRHASAAFVITADGRSVAGFYTLSAHVIKLADLPPAMAKKLARYPNVPATLLGRLAVSEHFRGQGVGQLLLTNALIRAWRATGEVASSAVVVDARDESARSFYLHHEFTALPAQPNRLVYLMASVKTLSGGSA